MTKPRCLAGLACILFVLAGLAGCGGQGVESKGTLTWDDGTPVAGANIRAVPSAEGVPEATGFTDKEGKFALQTNKGPGAMIGKYKVVVTKATSGAAPQNIGAGGQPPSPEEMAKLMKGVGVGKTSVGKSELPAVYSDPAQTPLELNITGASDKHELKLKKT